MAKPVHPRQGRCPPERRAEAIGLCLVEGLSQAAAAERASVSRSSLGRWLREARADREGRQPGGERLATQLERLKVDLAAAEARQGALEAQLSILRTETRSCTPMNSAWRCGAGRGGALTQDADPWALEAGPDTGERWKPHSRSQLGQDLWVLETLNWKRCGYFVEFGATNGVLLSNSWLLERHFGWQGICCEPNPRLFHSLRANRRCHTDNDCAYRTSGEVMAFVLANAYGGLAAHGQDDSHRDKRQAYESAGETLTVTTVSLIDLLERHQAPREIDDLSLDTEGSELAILEGIDWGRHRFRCLTVEHNFSAQRQGVAQLLEARCYRRIEAQWDDWYVLED